MKTSVATLDNKEHTCSILLNSSLLESSRETPLRTASFIDAASVDKLRHVIKNSQMHDIKIKWEITTFSGSAIHLDLLEVQKFQVIIRIKRYKCLKMFDQYCADQNRILKPRGQVSPYFV